MTHIEKNCSAILLTACICLLPTRALAFVPSTLFEADISASATYEKSTRLFRYVYKVANRSSSQQSIQKFGVSYDSSEIRNIGSPSEWDYAIDFSQDKLILWEYHGNSENPIPPGRSLEGFSFTSPNLPSIQSWHAASSYKYEPQSEAEETEISDKGLDHFFHNSNSETIIGPGTPPPADASGMAKSLIGLIDNLYEFKWFRDDSILNSLKVKLEACRSSLARGNTNSAKNQISAFINEVKAQKGKNLSPTTANILIANADYLDSISK